MNEHIVTQTIRELVAADFRTAAVLEHFGISFCCTGRRTLDEACQDAAADLTAVADALSTLPTMCDADDEAARCPVPRLIDYIISTHHAYLRSAMPDISRHLWKLARQHGPRRPELVHAARCFEQIIDELTRHMAKEELVLFPYMCDIADAGERGARIPSPFGTVANPIRMMEREHQGVADALKLIRELTHDYTAPEDGCATYAVAMAELQQFERDLERHVHLENDVLFPAALRIEGWLVGPSETSPC